MLLQIPNLAEPVPLLLVPLPGAFWQAQLPIAPLLRVRPRAFLSRFFRIACVLNPIRPSAFFLFLSGFRAFISER